MFDDPIEWENKGVSHHQKGFMYVHSCGTKMVWKIMLENKISNNFPPQQKESKMLISGHPIK